MNKARCPNVLAVALPLFFCVTANAAGSLADCAEIAADRERLACFDKLASVGSVRDKPDAAVAAAPATPARTSLLDQAWGFDPGEDRYLLSYYRPNYILPLSYTTDVNQEPFSPIFEAGAPDQQLDDVEARFQISFKSRVWTTDDRDWGVWIAYTQQSQWQVYNDDVSRPFRETNYMPEIFVSYRPDVQLGNFRLGLLNFGYNHQSNGRSDIISRSWDRLFAEVGIEQGDFALLARAWYRLNESDRKDDNPDITDYLGYGDLTAIYRPGEHRFSVMVRGNINEGQGAIEATWMSPPFIGSLRGYFRAFSGYGDSMIDYNWNQTVVGVGIALNASL